MMASFAAEQIASNFKPSGTEFPLAIRLSGQIQDSLPGRKTETSGKSAANKNRKRNRPNQA